MKRIMIAVICGALAFASPALAKNNGNNGKGHGKSKAKWENSEGYNHGGKHGRKHGANDRDILREYVIGQYRKNCPPGLAKKNPPCIPPGQAKKYGAGDYLPKGSFEPLPDYIVDDLTPRNGRYVRVDRNVYLITEGSRRVLEAIELFSAIE